MNFFNINNTSNHYHELIIAILTYFRFDPFKSLENKSKVSEVFNEDYLMNKYMGQYEKGVRFFEGENRPKNIQNNKQKGKQDVSKNKNLIKQDKIPKKNIIIQNPVISNN